MKLTAEDIERAKRALLDSKIINKNDYSYPSAFNGYISSFGASLVQAGLLPTVIFFERPDSAAEQERHLVIITLKSMMGIDNNGNMAGYILGKDSDKGPRRCDDPVFIDRVVRNMTAMKLALRMFNKIKENNYGQQ